VVGEKKLLRSHKKLPNAFASMTLHEVSEFTYRGMPRFMADQLKKPDFKKDWSTYK
jgi:hypothetical protein